jgi:mitogen-activated protein kinase 15
MWAVGCILGEMALGKPAFPGNSTMNQLERVLEATGRPTPEDIAAIRSPFAATMIDAVPPIRSRPPEDMFAGAPPAAIDLIKRCLQFSPDKRITAYEALRHPYVAQFHNEADEPACPRILRIQIDDNTKCGAARRPPPHAAARRRPLSSVIAAAHSQLFPATLWPTVVACLSGISPPLLPIRSAQVLRR